MFVFLCPGIPGLEILSRARSSTPRPIRVIDLDIDLDLSSKDQISRSRSCYWSWSQINRSILRGLDQLILISDQKINLILILISKDKRRFDLDHDLRSKYQSRLDQLIWLILILILIWGPLVQFSSIFPICPNWIWQFSNFLESC